MAIPSTKKQPICHLSIIVRSKSFYLVPKLPFLTPLSAAERLSSPFAVPSLAFNSILVIRPLFAKPYPSILYRNSLSPHLHPPPSAYHHPLQFHLWLSIPSLSFDHCFSAKPYPTILYRNSLSSLLHPPPSACHHPLQFHLWLSILSLSFDHCLLSLTHLSCTETPFPHFSISLHLPFLTPPTAECRTSHFAFLPLAIKYILVIRLLLLSLFHQTCTETSRHLPLYMPSLALKHNLNISIYPLKQTFLQINHLSLHV